MKKGYVRSKYKFRNCELGRNNGHLYYLMWETSDPNQLRFLTVQIYNSIKNLIRGGVLVSVSTTNDEEGVSITHHFDVSDDVYNQIKLYLKEEN
jgi:hypothetical protein